MAEREWLIHSSHIGLDKSKPGFGARDVVCDGTAAIVIQCRHQKLGELVGQALPHPVHEFGPQIRAPPQHLQLSIQQSAGVLGEVTAVR